VRDDELEALHRGDGRDGNGNDNHIGPAGAGAGADTADTADAVLPGRTGGDDA
jgi:hypothetical protein